MTRINSHTDMPHQASLFDYCLESRHVMFLVNEEKKDRRNAA